ncbi:hypothetical protein B0A55_11837 [Friedmanniomyces simplex]|uniref:Ketoreductase (KR) domain-containing protein n=1 Tax=Friedmanniomyces simplex TaxID=329884 RepID=A0A4V5NFH8_9PEZI|nr:hypothetical protein B0A55_11837 [Friedmanniomyces simplex]
MTSMTLPDQLRWTATFLRSQLVTAIPTPTADFSDQTVIVTGSNTGLGLEAARHLARLGAGKIILAVRTLAKGEAAAQDILRSCHGNADVRNGAPAIEVWQLDMIDTHSIRSFAERAGKLERLDAAVKLTTAHFPLHAHFLAPLSPPPPSVALSSSSLPFGNPTTTSALHVLNAKTLMPLRRPSGPIAPVNGVAGSHIASPVSLR